MASASGNVRFDRSRGTSQRCGNPLDGESRADGAHAPSALSFPDEKLMEGLRRSEAFGVRWEDVEFL